MSGRFSSLTPWHPSDFGNEHPFMVTWDGVYERCVGDCSDFLRILTGLPIDLTAIIAEYHFLIMDTEVELRKMFVYLHKPSRFNIFVKIYIGAPENEELAQLAKDIDIAKQKEPLDLGRYELKNLIHRHNETLRSLEAIWKDSSPEDDLNALIRVMAVPSRDKKYYAFRSFYS
jgi:hypothetical protein